MRVKLLPSGREFEAGPDEPVLEAALRSHINLPHSCKGGSCGTCIARVVAGTVRYPHGRPAGISADEEAAGQALICQGRAAGDLVIEVREIRHVTDVQIKSLPVRVQRMQRLAPDVMGLWLRWPAVEEFRWQAGQYLDVMLPGGRRRSFSMANPPHDAALAELHVRRAAGGEFSEQVFTGMREGALLQVEGPLGQFIYHPGEHPLLLVGGGTGYAPLKAMLRQVLETEARREVLLFRGVRRSEDLYEHDWLRALADRHSRFRYVPVLSDEAPPDGAEAGLVHEAVMHRVAGLSGYDIYAAGPPAMIDAVRHELPRHGADPARIFFDSFDYSPDALAKRAAGG